VGDPDLYRPGIDLVVDDHARNSAPPSGTGIANLPPMASPLVENEAFLKAEFPGRCAPLFHLGKTINGFAPVGGNTGRLMTDSNAGIDNIVDDMDAASDHIHLIFYIWLGDNNGLKVARPVSRWRSHCQLETCCWVP